MATCIWIKVKEGSTLVQLAGGKASDGWIRGRLLLFGTDNHLLAEDQVNKILTSEASYVEAMLAPDVVEINPQVFVGVESRVAYPKATGEFHLGANIAVMGVQVEGMKYTTFIDSYTFRTNNEVREVAKFPEDDLNMWLDFLLDTPDNTFY